MRFLGAAHCGRCAPFHEVTPAGAPCFTDVIPDGPQGRAGIQTGAPQDDWIPGSRCARPGMTAEKQNVLAAGALLFVAVLPAGLLSILTSSRPTPPLLDVIPAGAPCFTDVIPDGPQGRSGIQTGAPQDDWIPGSRCARPGMTAEKQNVLAAAALLFVAVPPPVRSVS